MTKRKENPTPMKGNKYGLKLKDPDVRQEAYEAYCAWLARGKTHKSFTFVKDNLSCTSETIKKYIKDNPSEFDPIKEKIAYSKGLELWEEFCEKSAQKKEKHDTASLNMIMRNKYGWDKRDEEEEKPAKYETQAELIFEALKRERSVDKSSPSEKE